MSDSDNSATSEVVSETMEIPFIRLRNNSKLEVRYIYHLSDIHIRNETRHHEYREVFARTYQAIKDSAGSDIDKSIIVVTGDIIHTKPGIHPEAISLAGHFFKKLSSIATTVIIPGNHDCNLSNKNRLDALTPLLEDIGHYDNLFYLKKSGIYQLHNIVFGITSIYDSVIVGADRIDARIWNTIRQKNKYRIALYHGPVHQAKTDVGYRMNQTELTIEDFQGYDFVMLGDIHRHQYMNDEKTIAYAGSLIQQTHGESLHNHGVLKWDLKRHYSHLIEIPNDYGFVTIKLTDGEMPTNLEIPPKPYIKFELEDTNTVQYNEVLKRLKKRHQICQIIEDSTFKTKEYAIQKSRKSRVRKLDNQNEIIRAYLQEKKHSESEIERILSVHAEIYRRVALERNTISDVSAQKWNLLELTFSNMLSYGKNNRIDFRLYEPNKIIGIMAPNCYGKSAILDIILFCLFDKFSRGDRRDIINKYERSMSCSLLFSIGSKEYRIVRTGVVNKASVKVDVEFTMRDVDDTLIDLSGSDRNETNRKIVELVGDYQDYLTTCFCLQQGKPSNFAEMTHQQKKEYLNEILKLNHFDHCNEIAKEEVKKCSLRLKELETKINTMDLDHLKTRIKELSREKSTFKLVSDLKNSAYYLELTSAVEHYSKYDPLTVDTDIVEFDLTDNASIEREMHRLSDQLAEIPEDEDDLTQKMHSTVELKDQLDERHKELTNALTEKQQKLMSGPKTELLNLEKSKAKLKVDRSNLQAGLKLVSEAVSKSKLRQEIHEIETRIGEIDESLSLDDPCESENLKNEISELKSRLKPVYGDPNGRMLETQKLYHSEFQEQVNQFTMKILSPEDQIGLKSELKARRKFVSFLSNLRDQVDEIPDALSMIDAWLDQNEIFKMTARKQLARKTHKSNPNPITAFNGMIHAFDDWCSEQSNHELERGIRKAERRLGDLRQKEVIVHERQVLVDKLEMLNVNLQKALTRKQALRDNKVTEEALRMVEQELARINDLINSTKTHIDDTEKEFALINKELNELESERRAADKTIDQLSRQIAKIEKSIGARIRWKMQLDKLDLHAWKLAGWLQHKNRHEKIYGEKQRLDREILEAGIGFDRCEAELGDFKKRTANYMAERQEYDELSERANIYQIYQQITNPNGVPYEILKRFLPRIQADVNQILHAIAPFNIELINNNSKIDINITGHGQKPHKVALACGFERFIIGLAIRMVLFQISLTAKPNFLIIDEGWGCLDTENINNVATIIDYIKSQYEHVILISHLDELKNQTDYVINIERINERSHIVTSYEKRRRLKSKSKSDRSLKD